MSLPIEAATFDRSSRDGAPVLGSKEGLTLNCVLERRLMSPKLSFLVPTFLLVVGSIAESP